MRKNHVQHLIPAYPDKRGGNRMLLVLSGLLGLLFFLSGCQPPEDKILYRKEGSWEVTSRKLTAYREGELQSEEVDTLSDIHYTFNEGGTGTLLWEGESRDIQWLYDTEFVDQLIISYPNDSLPEETWEIIVFDKKAQKWQQVQQGSILGEWIRLEITLDLKK